MTRGHGNGRRVALAGRPSRGYTLLEALFTVSLIVVLLGIAVPQLFAGLEEMRTRSAARYLAARLRLARAGAVARARRMAVQFEPEGNDYRYVTYLDGDGDGVRTADIRRGVDRRIGTPERLTYAFSGVRFGILGGVPVVDGAVADGGPVRIGASNLLTFSPDGTATPGTLYVCGRKRSQYAVRVLGATGRTRVLRYDEVTRAWIDQ